MSLILASVTKVSRHSRYNENATGLHFLYQSVSHGARLVCIVGTAGSPKLETATKLQNQLMWYVFCAKSAVV